MSVRDKILLYAHIPFCQSKCHFCFKVNSVARKSLLDTSLHETYVDALVRSIHRHGPSLSERCDPIGLNWGGGTPTTLAPALLARVAEAFGSYWDLKRIQFSVEATPESLTPECLSALREIGATRLSVGAQTFNDNTLRILGRPHTSNDISSAITRAKEFGFCDLNLDLIVTLPGDTIADAVSSVERSLELDVPHITTYFYNPAPNTVLLKRILDGRAHFWTEKDHSAALAEIRGRLEDAGYSNYEFFHWSRDPSQWAYVSLNHYFGHEGDVFGFGAGAQSFVAQRGNLEMPDLAGFMSDPGVMRPGRFDLEYSLERALGCRIGLNYAAIARTYGLTTIEVQNHPLTRSLARVPGVQEDEHGLQIGPADYMREHTMGVHSRVVQMRNLSRQDQNALSSVM